MINFLPSADIVILSNAPGELTTWVYPVLCQLTERLDGISGFKARISIVLSPCPNASGKEAAIVAQFPGVERVLSASDFYPFLLWGNTPAPVWDWHSKGIVIFLGGDQIYPVAIAKRLGYVSLTYAEWDARWLDWIDFFAVRNKQVADKIPFKYSPKVKVVGDLMVDQGQEARVMGHVEGVNLSPLASCLLPPKDIVFMPGSKWIKLKPGVPLCLAVADRLRQNRPDLQFAIALAPNLSPQDLAKYAEPHPDIALLEGTTAELVKKDAGYCLRTPLDTEIEIYTKFPARDLFLSCQVCLTTVGANTAELAALAVPMVVILPTNQLDAMRSWDGVLGILANLPVLGRGFAKLINKIAIWTIKRQGKLLAWPNIWAGEEIVPELLGHLTPDGLAELLISLLDRPEKLEQMRDRLRQVCGQPGAAAKIVDMAIRALQPTES